MEDGKGKMENGKGKCYVEVNLVGICSSASRAGDSKLV